MNAHLSSWHSPQVETRFSTIPGEAFRIGGRQGKILRHVATNVCDEAEPFTKTQLKQAARSAKEHALAAKQLALPDRRYGVILADPPWRWEPYSRETGMDRSAENHYATSGIEEIAALPVSTIAADDCVLFLWATVPCLEYALAIMKAWGFAYKSQFVWVKNKIGLGFWSRNKHELLLIGTRGRIPAPAPGTQWASVIEAPATGHSVKPDKALELIEHYFPSLPKIELHRRGHARPGWDCWGAEADQRNSEHGL